MLILKKSQQTTKSVKNYPACKGLITIVDPVFSAQHISQPPDVTNNAKSSRQADRVGRGVPSVRVAGNVGMDSDCKCKVLGQCSLIFCSLMDFSVMIDAIKCCWSFIQYSPFITLCLFVRFDSLRPINNLSVKQGGDFLG